MKCSLMAIAIEDLPIDARLEENFWKAGDNSSCAVFDDYYSTMNDDALCPASNKPTISNVSNHAVNPVIVSIAE